jgi:four helix bundle protein
VLEVYAISRAFPLDERFGLQSQLRRAAVSIAANLAEGCRRPTRADFARHVGIAEGSASETDYLLLLATQLGYGEKQRIEKVRRELDEILRILAALRLSLSGRERLGTATEANNSDL